MKNTGSVKESAGAVKDSKRGYFRGVRESKYKKKRPHRKAFGLVLEKREETIYKVRNGFEK